MLVMPAGVRPDPSGKFLDRCGELHVGVVHQDVQRTDFEPACATIAAICSGLIIVIRCV
jgi:hypothetical protein